jgi:hypothetical protein
MIFETEPSKSADAGNGSSVRIESRSRLPTALSPRAPIRRRLFTGPVFASLSLGACATARHRTKGGRRALFAGAGAGTVAEGQRAARASAGDHEVTLIIRTPSIGISSEALKPLSLKPALAGAASCRGSFDGSRYFPRCQGRTGPAPGMIRHSLSLVREHR